MRVLRRALIPTLVGVFLLMFLVIPMFSLIWVSFSGEPSNMFSDLFSGRLGLFWTHLTSGLSLRYYDEFIHSPRYYKGLVNGVLFSTLVTFGCCVVGVALALIMTRVELPFPGALRVLAILPLAIPSFLMALSFELLFGKEGMITRLWAVLTHLGPPLEPHSVLGCALVQIFAFFPLVFLTTAATLERMDPSLDEASAVLGAPRGLTFGRVSLAMLAPGIAAGAFLTFIRSFGYFATLQLLIPSRINMIVVEAYRDMSGNTYWGGAATLSTVMIGVILAILAIQKYQVERNRFETMTGRAVAAPKTVSNRAVTAVLFVATLLVLGFPVLNLAVIVLLSLSGSWGDTILPTSYTLQHYVGALWTSSSFLLNSLLLSAMALILSLFLAFFIAWLIHRTKFWGRHLLDFLVQLPFILPGTAFAVALITVFNNPPLALHLTVYIVVLAYVVTRTPYGVRSILASLQQIGPAMEESSKTLGATSRLTLWKVLVPLIRPGIIAGGIMIFISCMTDVAITLMMCPPDWYPLSLNVFAQIQDAHYADASAYGLVLMLIIFTPYVIMLKLFGVKQMSL
jgi:iron(III) transport system permease protein